MPNMQWTNNENWSVGEIECNFSIIQPWQFSEYTFILCITGDWIKMNTAHTQTHKCMLNYKESLTMFTSMIAFFFCKQMMKSILHLEW